MALGEKDLLLLPRDWRYCKNSVPSRTVHWFDSYYNVPYRQIDFSTFSRILGNIWIRGRATIAREKTFDFLKSIIRIEFRMKTKGTPAIRQFFVHVVENNALSFVVFLKMLKFFRSIFLIRWCCRWRKLNYKYWWFLHYKSCWYDLITDRWCCFTNI